MHPLLKSKTFLTLVGLLVLAGIGWFFNFWANIGVNVGYAPEQPIPFSHKRHAGDNHIPCLYCHAQADNSRHATVPSMNICMNCHSVVRTDSPLIQKLTELYKSGEAFEWVKVHDMPDFVYFSHKRHVLKGIDCSTCHGDVASMKRVMQVKPLNMGFCVNCHREKGAPQDCYTCHQ